MQLGEWDSGSACTKTCGGGTTARKRICNQNWHPEFDDCIGTNIKTDVCNVDPCIGTIMLIRPYIESPVIRTKFIQKQ